MNISMLQCDAIFLNEGIALIINTVVIFGHVFDYMYWRDFDFSVRFE